MTTLNDLNLETRSILTSHGTIHVVDTGAAPPDPSLPTLLLLHGNSSSSRIFEPLLRLSALSPHLHAHRAIALDLPGHGRSTNAPDPQASYTQPAYAHAAIQVLDALDVRSVIVLGWSLGGHNAIEMVAQLEEKKQGDRIKGIMITGTPPALGLEQVRRGFGSLSSPAEGGGKAANGKEEEEEEHINLAGTEVWEEKYFDDFPYEAARGERAPWIKETAKRTDGRARRIMFEAFEGGRGVDQVKVVEESSVPCAVVNGGDEPFVNLDYLDGIKYKNLWEGKCYRLPGQGHAPFWEEPETFVPYWARFVKYCSGDA
ncbi:Alpha/beta hydrolase fold-1 [Botryosphaeria dothidea]|uniref:Alpha/beta hydrolase fold-1 n=1 Tax=Botryosphaeria dothidea TaxID=55169 RepID=A0A8H4ND07_9PEZI|nr:Alpha/beta hydrolase fold-1 [Botryosphaeria dothidea]